MFCVAGRWVVTVRVVRVWAAGVDTGRSRGSGGGANDLFVRKVSRLGICLTDSCLLLVVGFCVAGRWVVTVRVVGFWVVVVGPHQRLQRIWGFSDFRVRRFSPMCGFLTLLLIFFDAH